MEQGDRVEELNMTYGVADVCSVNVDGAGTKRSDASIRTTPPCESRGKLKFITSIQIVSQQVVSDWWPRCPALTDSRLAR